MRVSGFHMPRWWQAVWRRRYPMGTQGMIELYVEGVAYRVRPMGCGCGYIVRTAWTGGRIGSHCPTLGGAIRQARRHARAGGAAEAAGMLQDELGARYGR